MYRYSWEETYLIRDELDLLELKIVEVVLALVNMPGENHDT